MYTSNPGPSHKQNYDQGGSPQAELRPGRLPTSKITTREPYPQAELRPGTWLAGWLAELRPGNLSSAWLAGWLVGWLAGGLKPREAQRGPERPREAQRGGCVDRTSLSCGWLDAPHKQIYKQGGSPQISLHMEPERKPPRTMYH